jgi:hypothetical protein
MINLESKPDGYLIKRVQKTNCEESLCLLIKRHTPLCYKIYKKYVPSFNVKNIDLNEFKSFYGIEGNLQNLLRILASYFRGLQ